MFFGLFGCGKIILLCMIFGLEGVSLGLIWFGIDDVIYCVLNKCDVFIMF